MMNRVTTALALAALLTLRAEGGTSPITRFTLESGVRVVVIHVEGSPSCAMISFLPLGLAADGADRTQWSHLVEHLVLRTTGPITDYRERNAETMAGGMHLDWIGSAEAWRSGLDLQAMWLGGLPFTDETLREEVPKALSEIDSTAPRGATYKWAIAAWNQVARHGRLDVSVRGALEAAALDELARYRDEHLVIPGRTLVCVIGGVAPDELRPALDERLGALAPQARALPRATADPTRPGDVRATWDLPVRHLLIVWPIPRADEPGHAAMHVASQVANARLAIDQELRGAGGPIFVGTDTVAPEATFFVISAPLADGASVERVRDRIAEHVAALADESALSGLSFMAKGLAAQLRNVPGPAELAESKRSLAAQMSGAIVEANVGLQRGLLEWRYGDVDAYAGAVEAVTAKSVAEASARCLTAERRSTLLLEPRAPAPADPAPAAAAPAGAAPGNAP